MREAYVALMMPELIPEDERNCPVCGREPKFEIEKGTDNVYIECKNYGHTFFQVGYMETNNGKREAYLEKEFIYFNKNCYIANHFNPKKTEVSLNDSHVYIEMINFHHLDCLDAKKLERQCAKLIALA